ncbi:MAG: GNAT family N-acetyltransferase [Hyphomicrobiaceae bacterium]|nr:GNAT family N-acetyltransferase [Hyphomicrobiaceae bacterium]
MRAPYPLRPFLVADTPRLQDLFAQSIEELTAEDYDEDQRLAWISRAADGEAFAQRLSRALTLIVEVDGEILGFASLADGKEIDMLYVHPYAAGTGVGATLVDALERIAAARGAAALTVDASDTAVDFFERCGYAALNRNSIRIDDVWVSNTTMSKQLVDADKEKSGS